MARWRWTGRSETDPAVSPGLVSLLPPDMGPWVAAALIVSAGFTSALTAGMGIGGGVLLLGIMAFLVPPAALIPVHGVAQIGSNVGRTWLMRRHVETVIVLPFALGALAGAFAGGSVIRVLPTRMLDLALAGFILYAVWGKWPALRGRAHAAGLWIGGIAISFLSMFVGATGPLVAALMKTRDLDRQRHMATFSACMSLQHGVKIAAFGLFGFAFAAWMPLLLAMITSGFIGTWLGERWLAGRSEAGFRKGLDWLLTAMALQLLWQALVT